MEPAGPIGSGRRGPSLKAQLEQLQALVASNPEARGPYLQTFRDTSPSSSPTTIALPVVADRIALPTRGAQFHGEEWLPLEIAATFLDPELLRSNRDAIAGRSKVHASTPEWMLFLRRLDSAGMLLLAAEDEIPRDAVDRVPRNGFFAVYKDDDSDRSVCARVPRNRMERQIGLVRHLLPHASQFCDVQLDTSEDLVLDGDDIGDYYHHWWVSLKRALSNAIGRLVHER